MHIIYIGAEGIAELGDVPWFRDPTLAELDAWRERHVGAGVTVPSDAALSLDRTGRPYWPKLLLDGAPEAARDVAERYWRVVRLEVT